jgi:Flp pilus assembly protein TadD
MPPRKLLSLILRYSIALLGLFCSYQLVQDAARAGVSRLFSATAIIQSRIEPADVAVRLTPSDPEAHYTRALTLVNLEKLTDAVTELRLTTRLRPHHYYEWLDLGVTLDRLEDQTGAETALRESVRLAPFFAQPRWQLGNLLYRQARYEEAFAEMRLGVRSNPSLTEVLFNLAWVAANGDINTVEALMQPTSKRNRLDLASLLASIGKGPETVREVEAAGPPGDEVESALLRLTITRLLKAQLFSDAYAVWAKTHSPAPANGSGQILNGDFMNPIVQNDPGFGWQVLPTPKVVVSIDPSGPAAGARSIRADFSDDNDAEKLLIHQLVLVEPKSRYSLSFMSRAEDLVGGAPPVIIILDAGSNPAKILGQSKPLSPGTKEWSTYVVDFNSDENTSAVIVAFQRPGCRQGGPCPVYGKLWLSRFSLARPAKQEPASQSSAKDR